MSKNLLPLAFVVMTPETHKVLGAFPSRELAESFCGKNNFAGLLVVDYMAGQATGCYRFRHHRPVYSKGGAS